MHFRLYLVYRDLQPNGSSFDFSFCSVDSPRRVSMEGIGRGEEEADVCTPPFSRDGVPGSDPRQPLSLNRDRHGDPGDGSE